MVEFDKMVWCAQRGIFPEDVAVLGWNINCISSNSNADVSNASESRLRRWQCSRKLQD